ncbi:16S rRNA (guanine(966)-N(2))-methyltransferase RsmD [Faecalispora anaeroviscerum]|uniref:16S rRNA (guanine(966)-N(2))-methyltransferase RsmD n=1 Tax=Faecalispora anaeroviscerum TaxID=2991836 RepID=UPI0024B89563|nr:16S rRNA (guanine(966)-N(2))-methyltransferase RsmD [Faecalispora anaeroviscerum]
MRIITGSARGKKLQSLEGERVRPTPDRVKEALFNIIQFDLEGRRVLDLFAGSGQLGLEAISRGAREAVFVDSSRDSVSVVEKNIAATGFGEQAKVVNADFASFLSRNPQPFDIALLDPPYRTGLLQQALPQVATVMNLGGTILCEHPSDEELPLSAGDFVKVRSYRYGKILLTVYRHKDVTSL